MYLKHARGLMVRRSYTELSDVIRDARQLYEPMGAKWFAADQKFIMPGGAELSLKHLENDSDAMLYQGWNLTRVYVEEAGSFALPDPIYKLMACLRSAHGVPCGIRLTGNPGGPGQHWLKERYIDPAPLGNRIIRESFKNPFNDEITYRDRLFIPAGVKDNKYLPFNEYVATLQSIGNPELVRAWLMGDWNAIAGAFFSNWSPRRHIIEHFKPPSHWLHFRAFDWGSAAPFACIWMVSVSDGTLITQSDGRRLILPRGALIAYREWYGASKIGVGLRMNSVEIAHGILERESEDIHRGKTAIAYGVADPAIFAQNDGPSIAERMAKVGCVFYAASNQRASRGPGRVGGWDIMRHRLDGVDGHAELLFMDSCPHAIRTIPSLQTDPAKPEDVSTVGDDHMGDAARYACASRPYVKRGGPIQAPEPAAHGVDGGNRIMVGDADWFAMENKELRWQRKKAASSWRI
jgi:hypothetical protein